MLEDVAEPVTVGLAATVNGGSVTWTFTVSNPPAEATNVFYRFNLLSIGDGPRSVASHSAADSLSETYTVTVSTYTPGTYGVGGEIQYVENGATHLIHADITGSQTITIP